MKFGQWFYQKLCHHGAGEYFIVHEDDLVHGKMVLCTRCYLTMPISEKVWKEWLKYAKLGKS